jgi:hypothetical protein
MPHSDTNRIVDRVGDGRGDDRGRCVSEQHLDVLAQPTGLAPQDFAMARAIKLGARAASELRQSFLDSGHSEDSGGRSAWRRTYASWRGGACRQAGHTAKSEPHVGYKIALGQSSFRPERQATIALV